MTEYSNLHAFTHVVINDLKKAYLTSLDSPIEVLILSAMVTTKKVYTQLLDIYYNSSEIDPEEYCAAI